MKLKIVIFAALLLGLSACRSIEVTSMEVLNSKEGKIIYRIDALESTMFSTRPVLGLICVPDSKGDLVCR